MRILKIILLVLLVLFIGIQFFRPIGNANAADMPGSIVKLVPVSDTVLALLKNSCYDCHSDNTKYPWYNKIQPVAWWLNSHVTDGKRALNFDEFASYPAAKQLKKLKGIAREVQSGDMPLNSYTWIHLTSRLSAGQKDSIIAWTNTAAASLAVRSPK